MQNKNKSNLLLIGGAGYIGSALILNYQKEKFINFINCYDRLVYENQEFSKKLKKIKKVKFFFGDYRNLSKLNKSLKGISDVIVLGGLVGDPITKKYDKLSKKFNLDGIKKILKFLSKKKLNKLIFISTCSNYGIVKAGKANEKSKLKPKSSYAKHKVAVEKFFLNLKTDCTTTVLRFSTAFGLSPRMRYDLTLNEFCKSTIEKKELLVYDPYTWRPYCHVKDFSNAFLTVLDSPNVDVAYNVFNVGDTNENYTKQMLVDEIKKIIPNSKIKYISKNDDPRDYRVNCDKIKSQLGFEISMKVPDGIKEITKVIQEKLIQDLDNQKYYNIPHVQKK